MELQMYLHGKFIDAVPITVAQLSDIHTIQHMLERKHCHDLEYTDDQPQFYISGVPDKDDNSQSEK